jgi:hypothetical protein
MHRALLVLVVVACKSPSSTTTLEEASVASAASSASAPTLPADFPAAGAPKVSGTLVSAPFTVAKAIARRSPDGASIDLYSWSEGGACEPQFAPKPEQLYVSVKLPDAKMKNGAVFHEHEDDVLTIYKMPKITYTRSETTIVIDETNATHTTGRILLTAPDGTRVSGSFDAQTCASPQQGAAASAPLLGVAWGTEVDPAAIPRGPVTMTILGKNAAPAAVEAIDWDDGQYAQHEIHFFATKPAKACNTDQMSGGFKIGFPSKLVKGLSMRSNVTLVTAKGNPFSVALWDEPGNVVGMEGRGFVSAILDDVTPAKISGRVVAWSNDASKSLIVGAFEATNCHVKL